MTHPTQTIQLKHQQRATLSSSGAEEVVRIELLGGFRVSVGSQPIKKGPWRLKKAAALVKLLALAPGHQMHRERAMDLLWPELAPKAAANNLRYTLHTVRRRLLEPASSTAAYSYLDQEGDLLTLCPEGQLWVDVEAFEDAAATARQSQEPSAYQLAVDLYTGELLPEDRYEGWAENRREELRKTYFALLIELAGLYEERKEFGLAIQALQRVVRSEPIYEEAHVGLMRLYALLGRRIEALRQYEQLKEVLSRELGEKPAASSRHLYEKIVAGQFRQAYPPQEERPSEKSEGNHLHNLPEALTSFVGRERELVEVKRALAMSRLLTLTGAGGSGKTRLALEVARDLVEVYPDGVWLVELAELSESQLVCQQIADVLGVREQPGRLLLPTLKEALQTKKLLLVLDNCEHLIGACAPLVETLLSFCPDLRVLATSREALGSSGEVIWRIPSLSLPEAVPLRDVKQLMRYESMQLFMERARYRDPAFILTQQNAKAVVEICRRLDGIPLAIELAAARVGTLDVEQISERLVGSLKLLTTGSRTAPSRHQTLRGALDWSYDLLSEPERKLFRRLSVFAGGCTLEAAEAVGTGSGIEKEDILDLLSHLVDKSLVIVERSVDRAVRYRLLEPLRQYGEECLEESGEGDAIRCQHATFFLALAEEAEPGLKGSQQVAWVAQLKKEYENLRAVLSWALSSEQTSSEQIELGLRLSGALGNFWELQGLFQEGWQWIEAALAKEGVAQASGRVKALRAKVLVKGAVFVHNQGDYERAVALSEQGLALYRELEDVAGIAYMFYIQGMTALATQTDHKRATALLEEAAALRLKIGDTVGLARALRGLSLVAVIEHNHEEAKKLYQESLALARQAGDKATIVRLIEPGAIAALGQGEHGQVRTLCVEGLKLAQQIEFTHSTAYILRILAALASAQKQPIRSARLWGAAEKLGDSIGFPMCPAEQQYYRPYIATACTQLGEVAWEAAWAEGEAMIQQEAIEYALFEKEPASSPKSEATSSGIREDSLTHREQQVAVLLARGLSNQEIAKELVISERTVEHHVSKILRKLGLHSRSQIATWLTEQQLSPAVPN